MWKNYLKWILPIIESAGEDYVAKDANDVGKDDAIGQSLVYVSKLLRAILSDAPLPKAPEVLK